MGGRERLRVEDKARMMAEPQGPPESRRETEVRASSLGEAKRAPGGQTTHVHGLIALEAGRPRSRCRQGRFPWGLALGLSVMVSSSFLCPHISRVVISHLRVSVS